MIAEVLTGTTVVVAVGAALATLVLVALVAVARSRRRRSDQRDVVALVSQMNTRMESVVQELAGALERMQEERRRNSLLYELGSSIDLEEVLARTLEAGGAVTGTDAALVSIHTDDKPIVATKGLSDEEARRQAIAYQYPASLEGEELVHSGLAVPLPGEAGSIGFIAIYSRSPTFHFEEGMIRELEELSRRAGPAI